MNISCYLCINPKHHMIFKIARKDWGNIFLNVKMDIVNAFAKSYFKLQQGTRTELLRYTVHEKYFSVMWVFFLLHPTLLSFLYNWTPPVVLPNQKLVSFNLHFLLYILLIKNNKNSTADHNEIFPISYLLSIVLIQ